MSSRISNEWGVQLWFQGGSSIQVDCSCGWASVWVVVQAPHQRGLKVDELVDRLIKYKISQFLSDLKCSIDHLLTYGKLAPAFRFQVRDRFVGCTASGQQLLNKPAMVYYAGKPMEISRVFGIIIWKQRTTRFFYRLINHLGCWKNTRRIRKSLARGLWFTNFSRVLPTSRVVYRPINYPCIPPVFLCIPLYTLVLPSIPLYTLVWTSLWTTGLWNS